MKKMPIIFVGHGSPMNAVADNIFTKYFKNLATKIPKPKAIVCLSAHWVTSGVQVTAMAKPKTIHDFYGFPSELYDLTYNAPGNPILAKEIQKLFSPTEVILNKDWGLDHGTWSVLKHMYQKANIPVVQISLDYNKSAEEHFELAKKLAPLRDEGILIIGSGNIIHNLREIDFAKINNEYGYDWAKRVQAVINQGVLDHQYQKLLDYKKQGGDFDLAIPTPEHFIPLLYILGLKEETDKIEIGNDVLVGGSLSMTSLLIS